MTERLQKVIAAATTFSRRKAEELIMAGKVMVNDVVVSELGTKVDPQKDVVRVNGKTIQQSVQLRYILLYKPIGVVCTRAQHKEEKTVYDLVPDSRDLVIAGRLDKESAGLVLLTNDGAYVNEMTHPRYKHSKEYEVVADGALSEVDLVTLQKGVHLEEGLAKADTLRRLDKVTVRIALHQGWNQQIRRMFRARGRSVLRLTRVRLGEFRVGNLKPGEWRAVQPTKTKKPLTV